MFWRARRKRGAAVPVAKLEGMRFELKQGLPHVDWAHLFEHVLQIDQASADDWRTVGRTWAAELAGALGDGFRAFEGGRSLVVAPDGDGAGLVRAADQAMGELDQFLFGSGGHGAHEPTPLLVQFEGAERFIDFLEGSRERAEGDIRGDSPLCIGLPVPLILLPAGMSSGRAQTLPHELTHARLAFFGLPQWVDEGMAQLAEEALGHRSAVLLDETRFADHLAHWNAETIQTLWSGEAFASVDDDCGLAYELSYVLMRNLALDHGEDARTFMTRASREDAGVEAARECMGVTLGALVEQFMGPGSWEPESLSIT